MEDHTIKYRVPSEDHEEMKRIYDRLPATLEEASVLASRSEVLRAHLPAQVLAAYGIR